MTPAWAAPLRRRPFALLWSGAFVSNIGTWMETVALGYYVTDETGQAAWTGLVAAAGFVPIAFLGPVGGALADRLPRKRLLLTTTLLQALLAALVTVLVATDRASPAAVTLIVFAGGCAASIGFPAYLATIPDLVPSSEIAAATGLGSTQYNLGRIIGPAAAAGVIAVGGVAAALAVNTLSFLAVAAAVVAIRIPGPRPGAGAVSLRHSLAEGLRFVRTEPGLRASFQVMCFNTLLAAPFIALIPAMAVTVLGGDETTTSVLVTAQGVGAVAAGLAAGGLVARHGVRAVMVAAVSLMPVVLALYAVAPTLGLMAPALAAVGAVYLTALNTFTTTAQLRSPAELRGRVLSLNTAVLGALYPLGSLVQGRIADEVGLRATTLGAALIMGLTLVAVRLARPGLTAPIDVPVAGALTPAPGAVDRSPSSPSRTGADHR